MKIGYCVEGSTDRALLNGLKIRWCPDAELVEGRFRGELRPREYSKACLELQTKGADVIILLRDANDENWRAVAKKDLQACGSSYEHKMVVGVCHRNVECWLVADAQYAGIRTRRPEADFRVVNPKRVFDEAMQITARDRKEGKISEYVQQAPLACWLTNKSFEDFYEKLRLQSKRIGCQLENLRAS